MKSSKVLIFIAGLFFLSGLLTAQATTTFDLNLSNFDAALPDTENIESVAFFGLAALTMTPSSPTTGIFTESGNAEVKYYDNGSGYIPILSNGAELQINFQNLTGTYDNSSAATLITFDPNQTIFLNYVDTNNIISPLAEFKIGAGSGGIVVDELGNPVVQTYYLTLTSDPYALFSSSTYNFEASLTASNFIGSTYVLAGEMNAVPVPVSILLLGSGLLGFVGIRRKNY